MNGSNLVKAVLKARLRRSRAAVPLRKGRRLYRTSAHSLRIPDAVDEVLRRIRTLLRGKPPRVSVIVATVGRDTLQRTIDSASWASEVIVVYDASEVPRRVPSGGMCYALGPTRHWAPEQRNFVSPALEARTSRSSTTTMHTRAMRAMW